MLQKVTTNAIAETIRVGSVGALLLAAACHRAPVEQETSRAQQVETRPTPPRQPNGVPAIDGKHFAEEAMYRGACVDPPQGGGGCWSVRLFPDGSAEHMYVDALSRERYEIDGQAVVLRTSEGKIVRLESADGFLTIGDYKFVPPGQPDPMESSPAYIVQ